MTAVVHRTPGLIDIRSFTVMGMSAKPKTDTPIGMFGTGLKYAIAVLVRAGARPVLWIGRDRYEFFCEPTQFRGSDFQLVRMRHRKWGGLRQTTHNLPFTTEYGRNWKMWMAYREIESNTRDEGGETFLAVLERETTDKWLRVHDHGQEYIELGQEGYTTIVIDHPEYTAAHEDMDSVFLPTSARVADASSIVDVILEPSQQIYRRGLRALDASKPAVNTYNFLGNIELTEDRTIKSEYMARYMLASHLLTSENEDVIRSVITCDEDQWEHGLDFPPHIQPGPAFRRVVAERNRGTWSSAHSHVGRYTSSRLYTTTTAWDRHPRPWSVVGDTMRDAKGVEIFTEPFGYRGEWAKLAMSVIGRLAMEAQAAEPVLDLMSYLYPERRDMGHVLVLPDDSPDQEYEEDEDFL